MRCAFVTDEHHPFQDDHARAVALKIMRDFDPDMVVVGSDGIDFYQVSHFDKNPERVKLGLQAEIDSWKKGVKEWKDAAPHAEFKYILGNHEDRLRKYLWRHPELFGLDALKLPNLLGFDELGIVWNEKEAVNGIVLEDKLVVRHGNIARKWSGWSAKAELEKEKFAISVLTGHVHRGGLVTVKTRNGLVHAQEGYCLCDMEPEYVDHPDWHQGIVMASVTERGVSFEPASIESFRDRKRALWRGKEYTE